MDSEVLTDRSCDCHLQSNSKMRQIVDATSNYTDEIFLTALLQEHTPDQHADILCFRNWYGNNLLKAAMDARREDIVTMILDQLSGEQQVKLIIAEHDYEFDAVQQAVCNCQHSILRLLLSKLPAGERYKIIAEAIQCSIRKADPVSLLILLNSVSPAQQVEVIKHRSGYSYDDIIAHALSQTSRVPCRADRVPTPSFEILRLLLRRLSIDDKIEAITRTGTRGENALTHAVLLGSIATLNVLLEGLTHEQQAQVITGHSYNALVCGVQFGKADMLSILLSKLTAKQILHALRRGKEDGIAYFIRSGSRQNLSPMILERLSPDQQADLICCQDSRGCNDVMIAVIQGGKEVLSEIVGRLSPEKKYSCITSQTTELGHQKIGYNALMLAVDRDICKGNQYWMQTLGSHLGDRPENMISILLHDLTPEQQMTAILQENSEHRNAIHLTERDGALTMCLLQYIPLEHMAESISSLETQWKGVLHAAVKEKNNDILSCILHVYGDRINEEKVDITSHISDVQSLNVEQIRILSPYNSRYIFTQGRDSASHKYSLICYSTADRNGAEEEATYIHKSFCTSGFESALIQWNTFEELEACLLSHIQSIRDDSNLLFVALLSHGYRGGLQGRDGSHGDINKLLRRITENMHSYIPLVMMVQSCQQRSDEQMGLAYRDIDDGNIILRRPHTVLLLSTVADGLSMRGAYSTAIADEVSESDGEKDIYQMHVSAFKAIKQHPEYGQIMQIPEYRATLDKDLILPQAEHYREDYDSGHE